MTRYPIIHKPCGQHVLWYVGPPVDLLPVRLFHITHLDGSAMEPGTIIICPCCGEKVWPGNVKRLLDKPYEI